MLDVPSRPFDKPGLTKFSDDIVNLGHLVAARQAALRRGFAAVETVSEPRRWLRNKQSRPGEWIVWTNPAKVV
jgi:hypothetical protein